MVTLGWLLATVGANAEPLLEPDVPVERELAAGETHTYRLELTGTEVWKVSVEQLGVDVELTLVPADGERIVTDSPLDRAGTESLVVRSDAAANFQVEVHARERAAPRGQYRILREQLPVITAIDRKRLTAETIRMEAAHLYAHGAARRSEALERYRRAADHWRTMGENREETRDLYCVAVLERLVGETRMALESARALLPRWRLLNDRVWEAATLNEIGLLLWHLDENQEARELFNRALGLRNALGDSFSAAKTNNNVCLTDLKLGQLRAGLNCYRPLLEKLIDAEEPQLTATVLTNIGWANDTLGEPDAALDAYQQALALRRAADDSLGTARTLNNLAFVRQQLGDFEDAISGFEQALELFRELQDLRWQGQVLNNIGYLYLVLGEWQRAPIFLDESLSLLRKVGDRRREFWAWTNLGFARRRLGEYDDAQKHYEKALVLATDIGDPRLEAIVRTTIGLTYLEADKGRLALEHGTSALNLLQGLQFPTAEADALQLIGRALLRMDDPYRALPKLEKALALLQGIRSETNQAGPLIALAQAERDLGRLDRARNHIEAVLHSTEMLRRQVATADLRALFQSSRSEAYEFYIDLLMELHRIAPDARHDQEALAASEFTRARALLDLLNEAGAEIPQGVDGELLKRRVSLGRRLNAKAARRTAVHAAESTLEEREKANRELSSTLFEFDRMEAEIRRKNPRYAALTQPRTLSAEQIQRLLDPDTLLLEYSLGKERSFLWLVSSDRVQSFELPASRQVEKAARHFHELLSKPGANDRHEQAIAASALSQMLLSPIAEQLGAKRLVVVAHGALHYVPFGALPTPESATTYILERHELVYLPSASVLAELRRRIINRNPPTKRLALVADPVFESQDPRLEGAERAQPSQLSLPAQRSLQQPEASGWRRLQGSRQEADAIIELTDKDQLLLAVGFEANRATVLSDDLGLYRVVHFATHGVIDTTNPRLSGIVLSLFDSDGKPSDGFLRTHDVFNLNLAADLVVLSGCQTALGREVRGEGLLGLTRGFMYAGAPRVVASLWRVEDRATAELMSRFYHSMWVEGATPAAALRSAQLSILRERRWQDPYYWSSFIMQGEWQATPPTRTDHAGEMGGSGG